MLLICRVGIRLITFILFSFFGWLSLGTFWDLVTGTPSRAPAQLPGLHPNTWAPPNYFWDCPNYQHGLTQLRKKLRGFDHSTIGLQPTRKVSVLQLKYSTSIPKVTWLSHHSCLRWFHHHIVFPIVLVAEFLIWLSVTSMFGVAHQKYT